MSLLKERWTSLCSDHSLDGATQWDAFDKLYAESVSAYHNIKHIEDCLAQLDAHRELADDAVAVEFAIWFHDVIYVTRASDNEEQSANVAAEFLAGTTLADTVHRLIMATRHNVPLETHDERLMVDIDLSVLGRDAAGYDRYAAAVRKEYFWVEEAVYREKRGEVLERFLERENIYELAPFRERLEEAAWENLRREIVSLRRE